MQQTMIHGTLAGHDDSSGYDKYSPWLDLAAAIVEQAVDDYIRTIRLLWSKKPDLKTKRKLIAEKAELEDFFHSDWYASLTDIDPDRLIYQCRVRAREKEQAAIRSANKKKIKELLKAAE